MSKILLSLILLLSIGFSGCKPHSSDDIDGGVVTRNSGEDAPKIIDSDEIISFDCEFSFISTVFDEESELEGKVYKMSAALEDNTVKVKIDLRDRSRGGEISEFNTDISFMAKLQGIIAKYDLAKHNGYIHRVSGLPDMYGECIDIKYSSGEYIYAFDNQSGFISMEAMVELIELFKMQ